MSEASYMVNTVAPDLRPEETIQQICNALEQLDQIANDVFTRIGRRVTHNRQQLNQLNDRIVTAQARIDHIKGSNKAMRVFSSSKYPGGEQETGYQCMYSMVGSIPLTRTHRYTVNTKHTTLSEKIITEKRQYYNVQLKPRVVSLDDQSEGLGRLPHSVPSISSLLLFNTSENPYKKYVMLDPLGVVTKTRLNQHDEAGGPSEAPSTILQREELVRQTAEKYFYMPGLGEVPALAVPDFLPDLPGIAGDLNYCADQGPSIAPSVPGSNMPDLPVFISESSTITPASSLPPPPGPPPPAGPLPLPGPPSLGSLPSGPPTSSSAGMPPPPPPPPPLQAPQPSTTSITATAGGIKQDTSKDQAAAVSNDDSRASLLASIRAAGGAGKAKLRSTPRKAVGKKKAQMDVVGQTQRAAPAGDLMGDLANKLALRRKGISGTGKSAAAAAEADVAGKATSSGGNPMDRLSKMIPTIPQTRTSASHEKDWE